MKQQGEKLHCGYKVSTFSSLREEGGLVEGLKTE